GADEVPVDAAVCNPLCTFAHLANSILHIVYPKRSLTCGPGHLNAIRGLGLAYRETGDTVRATPAAQFGLPDTRTKGGNVLCYACHVNPAKTSPDGSQLFAPGGVNYSTGQGG